ncbi:post-PEP-CTERM-1 domain-containing protein [Massilia sp. TS11]|uniref:post-PEP-CTERM-1 domain-containing protein n=1 Tax=Massilia sp. TS11 TaxID=2908003 RepID=UPI001ED9E2A6|nr:hypothetical protein [Massilia sp. TS11]MCG2584387.1 hypothetical protein [Massilia sp. TS11]
MKFLSPVLLALLAAQASAQQVIMVRDPDTGQTRAATAAEMAELQAQSTSKASMLASKPQPPRAELRRDGSQRVPLGRSRFSYSVVQRDGAGQLHEHCVQGEGAATQSVHQQPEARHEDR